MKRQERAGFTLLEVLISITIFSGIMILAMAAFARTATSSNAASVLRNKTEAVRSVVDRISTDFHYLSINQDAQYCTPSASCSAYRGYLLNPVAGVNSLVLALRYPGDQYVRKTYTVSGGSVTTLTVLEERGCAADFTSCSNSGSSQAVLDGKYQLDANDTPVFDGRPYRYGDNGLQTGYVRLTITIKPVDMTGTCAASPTSCYTVSTTLVPRGY